ncbi:hypothetical protein [Shimazuella kribbensis]|uniref:hypothetical protein n=1 Tax=Shimazuella kribbensis TaxID=139808 RepID=UPI0004229555|nr:hypothetical protein [Shimazuella kribbensis]
MGSLVKKIVGTTLVMTLSVGTGVFAFNSIGDTSAQTTSNTANVQTQTPVQKSTPQKILIEAEHLKKKIIATKKLSRKELPKQQGVIITRKPLSDAAEKKILIAELDKAIKILKQETVSKDDMYIANSTIDKIKMNYNL